MTRRAARSSHPDMFTQTFDSIVDMAHAAVKCTGTREDQYRFRAHGGTEFYGVAKQADAVELALNGWHDETAQAMRVASEAVATVEHTNDLPRFVPQWDVVGSTVDVGAFLAGEPENMIEYVQETIPVTDRLVTLCASIAVSGAVSINTIKRRGHAIAGLAIALCHMGYNVELWAEYTSGNEHKAARTRTLVKSANGELDVSRVMFAYCHPAAFRALMLPVMHNYPDDYKRVSGVKRGAGYGPIYPRPIEDMPEGTIYLPPVISGHDVPDADRFITDELRKLGLI